MRRHQLPVSSLRTIARTSRQNRGSARRRGIESTAAPASAGALLAQCAGLLGPPQRSARLAAHRNDPAHCPALSCSILWHERLEPGDLRCPRASRRRDGSLSVVDLCSLTSSQRRRDAAPGLCPHDYTAPLARLVEQPSSRPLAEERPLLSAKLGRRRPPEPGISHCRRRPGCN